VEEKRRVFERIRFRAFLFYKRWITVALDGRPSQREREKEVRLTTR
jgi:hypothetical protein